MFFKRVTRPLGYTSPFSPYPRGAPPPGGFFSSSSRRYAGNHDTTFCSNQFGAALGGSSRTAAGAGARGKAGGARGKRQSAGAKERWNFQPQVVAQPGGAEYPRMLDGEEEADFQQLHRPHYFSANKPAQHRWTRTQLIHPTSVKAIISSRHFFDQNLRPIFPSNVSASRSPPVPSPALRADVSRTSNSSPSHYSPISPSSPRARSTRRVTPQRSIHTSSASADSASVAVATSRATPPPPPASLDVSSPKARSRPAESAAPSEVHSPPTAARPLVRRNSVSSSSVRHATPSTRHPARGKAQFGRPRSASMGKFEGPSPASTNKAPITFSSPAAALRHADIVAAKATGDHEAVKSAARQYLAVESEYSTATHVFAMGALKHSRPNQGSVALILSLFNDLATRPGLSPTLAAYQHLLTDLGAADRQRSVQLERLANRKLKRQQGRLARGLWQDPAVADSRDDDAFAQLEQEDLLTPAINILTTMSEWERHWLGTPAYEHLIGAAARRGRVELVHSLLDLLESSADSPTMYTYVTLLGLHGSQKDAQAIKATFENFLQSAVAGTVKLHNRASYPQLRKFVRVSSVKHRYASKPIMGRADEAYLLQEGGEIEAVWRQAMAAYFDAGDAASAVSLLDQLLQAHEDAPAKPLPPGYPPSISTSTYSVVVGGLAKSDAVDDARRWFDRVAPSDQQIHSRFFAKILYSIERSLQHHTSLEALRFYSYVAKDYLSRTNFDHDIPLITVIADTLMQIVHHAPTGELRREASNTLVDVAKVARQRRLDLGTGIRDRLVLGLAASHRWEEALSTLHWLSESVLSAVSQQSTFRPPKDWALQLLDPVVAILDFRVASHGDAGIRRTLEAPRPEESEVPLGIAASAAATWRRAIVGVGSWPYHREAQDIEMVVVRAYLFAKSERGIPTLLPEEWLSIVQSFALVASYEAAHVAAPANFPGFEAIVDDLCSARVPLVETEKNIEEYKIVAKALDQSGMGHSRIRAVLRALNATSDELFDLHRRTAPGDLATSSYPTSTLSTPLPFARPGSAPPVLPSSTFVDTPLATPLPSLRIATPPATPPQYLLELPSPPPPPVPAHEIDKRTTSLLEELVRQSKSDFALRTAIERAGQGRFAHPAVLSSLIELLGRESKLSEARHVYMLGYSTLHLLAGDPQGQSSVWAKMEDAMIITLAKAKEVEEAAMHRSRLVENGSAPSADAYAALISNMRETTNDAAVALELFAESQRLGVAPNVFLFNTLISRLSKARRAREAVEYFELMKSFGLRPSSISYGAVINACCKTGDDATAAHLFEEMVSAPGFKPRIPPYNTMLQFYVSSKPSRERVLYYFDQVLAAGCLPTDHTYKLLLDAYSIIGEPDIASVVDVFRTIVNDPNVKVTGPHWASLITAWGIGKKDLGRAIETFKSIESHPATVKDGLRLPDAVCYEALFEACLSNGRPELCASWASHAANNRVKLNAYALNSLIKAHILSDNLVAARAVFEAMADPEPGAAAPGNHSRHTLSQYTPTGTPAYREPSTYDIMIRAELAAGNVQKAAEMFSMMERRAFPEAVLRPMRKLLADQGIETLQF